MLDPPLNTLQELLRVGRVHRPLHRARVDGVDGAVLGQLAAPGARHGLDGGLGAAVDGLAHEASAGRNGRDVDDAAGAVLWQKRLGGLDQQEGTQDVDAVGLGEVVDFHVGNVVVAGDAGVVDDDVDLEGAVGLGEGGLGGGDDGLGTFEGADVGLHGHGGDGVGLVEAVGEFGS